MKAAQAEDGYQVVIFATLGHKADVGFMALGPDLWRLRRLQSALQAAGLEIVDSYVSLTEVSEYAQHMTDGMKRPRLYPTLPPEGKQAICFYPMSKRRNVGQNWFALPYEERERLMHEHGTTGRSFAGQGRPARHRLGRPRRLGVERHPVRRAPRRPQGGRLQDALRRGLRRLRRVRPVHHRHARRGRRGPRRRWLRQYVGFRRIASAARRAGREVALEAEQELLGGHAAAVAR